MAQQNPNIVSILPDQISQRQAENQLFPHHASERPPNVSVDFAVEDNPIAIRAFNLAVGDELLIEMKGVIGCKETYAPFWYCNCPEVLKFPKTIHFIEVPGTYRLIYSNQAGAPSLENILVTKTVAAMREHVHKPTAGCGNC